MKKRYLNLINNRSFLLVIILMILITSIQAQTNNIITPPPYPQMWVSKLEGQTRRDWFMKGKPAPGVKSKYEILKDIIGSSVTDSIICPINNLSDFIDSLTNIGFIRFYFAQYIISPGGIVPSGFNKDITLIIAPLLQNKSERGDYYNITPNGQITLITKPAKLLWVASFENNILPELYQTLIANDSDNLYGGKYTDTKTTTYSLKNFIEFLDTESTYQKSKGNYFTAISIDFCSYPMNGITCNGKTHYKNRLILQFEYTRKSATSANSYEVLYIDDEGENRIIPPCKELDIKTSDNGQLCPTYCQ